MDIISRSKYPFPTIQMRNHNFTVSLLFFNIRNGENKNLLCQFKKESKKHKGRSSGRKSKGKHARPKYAALIAIAVSEVLVEVLQVP